jgi:hypothetical protein
VSAIGGFAFAANVSHTERMAFPAGGMLRLVNSNGELTIDGWDQSAVEVTTLESAETDKQLEGVRISTERKGDEIVVTTMFPKHPALVRPFRGFSDSHLEYRIKAPRNARLTIDHNIGEVHIFGISGDVHATSKMGQITVQLPEEGRYAIDAKSLLGAIDSDFPGDEHTKRKFGHTFSQQAPSPSQKLYFRIGFGDIAIVKTRIPPMPAPLPPR